MEAVCGFVTRIVLSVGVFVVLVVAMLAVILIIPLLLAGAFAVAVADVWRGGAAPTARG